MTAPVEDDEFTELRDAKIPRVDGVGKGANGFPRWLIAKQADGQRGLLDPAFVRDLVAKAGPEPESTADEKVTMTGSPAAIAKLIHQAARRQVDSPTDTPDNRDADGSSVAKEMDMADDALDPTTVLAEPEGDAPGMDTDPGSPAWEAIDAATARKWTSILARAKAAVDMLADRELLEAAAGDVDDAGQAMDLQDACCAIDYAISVLAPFAVAEQAEADCLDEMQAVGKALAGWDPQALDTIEALGQVRKAGRVLSSANEAAIRGAVDSLQKVLASLPAAPVSEEESGRPVAKTEEVPVTEPTPAPVGPAEPTPSVVKADAEGKAAMRAVYDAKGHLVGIVDPMDITPIEDAAPGPDDDDAAASAEAAPADAAAAPESTDLTPASAGEVGTPADAVPDDEAVTKQTDPQTTDTHDSTTTSDAVLKSIADVIRTELGTYSATHEQVIAKQAADLAAMAETVEMLKGQVKALEEQPAEPKVFTNGAVPPAQHLRGQDRGATPVDVAKAAEMKKTLYGGNATEQNKTAHDMQALAIARLQEIHQRR